MGNYLGTFEKAFENADFIKLTYQALGIFFALVVLFILALAIKTFVNSRIRKIALYSMDFKDLKKMRRTGLVSAEEYERIKSGIVKHFIKDTGAGKEKAEKAGQVIPGSTGLPKDDRKSPPPFVPAPPSPPSPKAKTQPIDIDELLKRGLITPEEYQKLTEIHRKKTDA